MEFYFNKEKMLFSYKKCIDIYKTDYLLEKAISENKIFKVEKGVYSDSPSWSRLAVIAFKNQNLIFTMNSAFYYQDLTDEIPDLFFVATERDSSKLLDKDIKQYFYPKQILSLGVEEKKVYGTVIKVYTKERMLIELIRHKNKIPFDYYKEIVSNYRNKIYQLDVQWLEENVLKFPASKKIMDSIQLEVF